MPQAGQKPAPRGRFAARHRADETVAFHVRKRRAAGLFGGQHGPSS